MRHGIFCGQAGKDENAEHGAGGIFLEAGGLPDAEERLAIAGSSDDRRRKTETRWRRRRVFQQFENIDTIAGLIAPQQCQEPDLAIRQTMKLLAKLAQLEKTIGEIAHPVVGHAKAVDGVAQQFAVLAVRNFKCRRRFQSRNPEHFYSLKIIPVHARM